ncbi:DoxX family protein [Actinocrispum wychmicini]|uniref:DoxX-like protein n=1 Tax=Actinocrispum wychmicini TaxID=1213861 RepID=A0A4R2JHY9_9PSEU|nr:DoxX family protein [Actinocrispum wychmicini]TCO53735.1 DoxX-like protein [Actinocrispum wychmicini]
MTSEASTTARAGVIVNVVVWIVQVGLGGYMIYSGWSLFGAGMVGKFDEIGVGQWLRYVTGVLEIAGGIGVFIPMLCGLAALGLALVLLGATLTELFMVSHGGPTLPLILLVVAAAVAVLRRDTTVALVKRVRS